MILYLIFCFLIGSIPAAFLISKLKGINIKKVGSGNSGATNVFRTVGLKEGIIVMILDITKGSLAVYSIHYFLFQENQFFTNIQISAIGGFFSILGHIYSPFLKFKGGKGAATSIGVYLVLSPITCLIAVIVSICIILYFKKASIGTLVGILTLPIFFYFIDKNHIEFDFILKIIFLNIALILFSHKENIKRIIDGNELNIKK